MSIRHGISPIFAVVALALTLAGGLGLWASPVVSAEHTGHAAPDLDAVLSRTIAQVARDRELEEQFKARYAFTRTKVTETRDGSGALKKRSEEHFVNPTPAEEGAPPRGGPDADDATQPEAKRPYQRHDFKVDAALLERFRFTYLGAAVVEGRAVWVVDFEPAGEGLPARSLKERFVNLMAGRLWIDQEEAALARAEFRLTGPVNVAGGLVGALKRCAVSLDRRRTPDGLWYPRLLTWEIEGRKLFSTRRMEHRDEMAEVRPVAQLGQAGRALLGAP